MFGFFSLGYLLFLAPGLLLAAWASYKVRSAYNTYRQLGNSVGLRGVDIAQRLAQALGLRIHIEETEGILSDHYDPSAKTVRLSSENYHGRSIAALAVAAHEVGHALQDKEGNALLRFRAALAPAASFGSNTAWILIFVGLMLHMTGLAWAGVIAFGAATLFHMVTLPVELDASAKAKRAIFKLGLSTGAGETNAVSEVLSAAAFTYVAAALTALLQLAYFALQVLGVSSREEN